MTIQVSEEANVNIISGIANLIEGSGRANIMLPEETKFYISNALYSSKFRRNLLSFKDIHRNEYHIETANEMNLMLNIFALPLSFQPRSIFWRSFPALSPGLYHTTIRTIESHIVMNQKVL